MSIDVMTNQCTEKATAKSQNVGVRSAVDPHGVFLANHRLPRLFEDGRPTA